MLAQAPLAGRARSDLATKLRSFPIESYIIFYIPPAESKSFEWVHGRQDINADDAK
jgi:plasmid stabilization system protein ParE